MERLTNHLTHPLLAGFVVASSTALFVRYGISFTLYLLHTWQVTTFHTIIFYGLLFVLAKAGVRGRSQRRPLMEKPSARREAIEDLPKQNSRLSGIWKVIWAFLGIFSVLWLTPALIIYWMYVYPYPNQMIGELVVLLSVAAAGIYFIGRDKQFPARVDKILFFAGACLGPAAVVLATL